ncbi:hypothetical protein BEWA_006300 [Theileria equi strain WA]|uniref:Uncharacterized protein n=1 Tax=Theileria equi strain WA TaxID=1537102 RepID=L0B1U5_THEEQ|nr:hypothetical protein BEWA_006300 [Theileria equi strain WA]AFZ81221.1 hypothetical protein BEWA_006300 [Theileria equi strain WA]|eukprot:XP_004830887.1 hypothetical protein BEWA_006300 [Theileria equi strain WA]
MPRVYYDYYRKRSNSIDSDSSCSCGECACDSSYSSSCCSSDCDSTSSFEDTPRFEVSGRRYGSTPRSPDVRSAPEHPRQGVSVPDTLVANGEPIANTIELTTNTQTNKSLGETSVTSSTERPCTPTRDQNRQRVDFTINEVHSGDMQKEIDEIEMLLNDSYIQDFDTDEHLGKVTNANSHTTSLSNYTDTSYYGSGYSTDDPEGNTPNSQEESTTSDPYGRVIFSADCAWPSGFNNIQWNIENNREYDISELYAMLVSLDLPTYMYIMENVLDECVRREIEGCN